MKSAEFLQKEINSIIDATATNNQEIAKLRKVENINDLDRKRIKSIKAAIKRDKTRQAFLKTCLLYINTSPNEDYLKREVERISNRINLLLKGYRPLDDERHTKSQITKHKNEYEKEMGVPKIRKQLTTINYN